MGLCEMYPSADITFTDVKCVWVEVEFTPKSGAVQSIARNCSFEFTNVIAVVVAAERLPEIPDDTPNTNVLLRTTDKVPQYANTTANMAYRAVGKSLIDYEIGLSRLEERLEGEYNTINGSTCFR